MSRAHGFPRRLRLTRGAELDVVRREGKRVRTEHLEVRVLASLQSFPDAASAVPTTASPILTGPLPRVGLVVPKHRHDGVDRNRLKRRLRELIRLTLLPDLPPVALVVRVRPEAYGATFEQLGRQIARVRREVARLAEPRPAAVPVVPVVGAPDTPAPSPPYGPVASSDESPHGPPAGPPAGPSAPPPAP